jgi:hypothetical protein
LAEAPRIALIAGEKMADFRPSKDSVFRGNSQWAGRIASLEFAITCKTGLRAETQRPIRPEN